MQAAQIMAGYSLGGADLLRRAMGKKKPEVMEKERVKFQEGCVTRGIPETEAREVFDLMEKFAGYGFNKSHSAAYALITFQTAYLKTYFPVEFMAALLSTETSSTENIVKYIAEARSMGIQVLPPDVNESDASFTVDRGAIRFGMSAIKGLGASALEAILAARARGGAFEGLYEFCERVPLKQLNKKTLETLVRSGAFDGFGRSRAQLASALDGAIEAAKSVQKAEAAGQVSLFGAPELAREVRPRESYADISEWPELERLSLEKSALGFYVTGHPLDRYAKDIERLTNARVSDLEQKGHRADVTLACVITALRERPLRDGSGRMAFIGIEDQTGAAEMLVSAHVFGEVEDLLRQDVPLLLRASVSVDRDEEGQERVRLRCTGARPLSEARQERTRTVVISVDEAAIDARRLEAFNQLLGEHKGSCPVRLIVRVPETAEVEISLPHTATPTDAAMDAFEQVFGQGSVTFA